MSHVAKMTTVITDLDALKKAAEICGLEFREGQMFYNWYGRHVGDYKLPEGFKASDIGKCVHALSIAGTPILGKVTPSSAYEVGVVKKKNGEGYELLWDFFAGGNGLQQKIGGKEDCNRLVNEYNRAMMENVAESQGLALEEEDYDEVTGEAVMYLCEYE